MSQSSSSPKNREGSGARRNRKQVLTRRGTIKQTVPPILETTASVLGQIISSTAIYPIDIVKVVLQTGANDTTGQSPTSVIGVCRMLIEQSGPMGFYRGIIAEYIKESMKMGVFFGVKSSAMSLFTDKVTGKISWVWETICGMVAGVLTQAVLIPLSVAHVRMQNGVSREGLIRTIINIGKTGGASELWKGLAPSVILAIYPALNFLFCSRLKDQWKRYRFRSLQKKEENTGEDMHLPPSGQWSDLSLNGTEQFVIGALAQCLSTAACYPLILSRIVLQGGLAAQPTMMGVLKHLVVTRGVFGLFSGIAPMLFSNSLSGAFQWLGKEKVEELMLGMFLSAASKKRREILIKNQLENAEEAAQSTPEETPEVTPKSKMDSIKEKDDEKLMGA